MREILIEYCTRYDRSELLLQWQPEKNGELTPDRVSYGSQKKIWWICDRGHEWQSPPYARVGRNAGCPYCAGKKVAPGQDLRSLYPDIAAQWHPVKNGRLRPEDCLPGSHRSVWWQCAQGHEWKALVKARIEGCGCPVCTGKLVIPGENDLQSYDPELIKQWHPEKNGPLTPEQVAVGSSRKVWWRCIDGHEWKAAAYSRTGAKKCGCPVCAGKPPRQYP